MRGHGARTPPAPHLPVCRPHQRLWGPDAGRALGTWQGRAGRRRRCSEDRAPRRGEVVSRCSTRRRLDVWSASAGDVTALRLPLNEGPPLLESPCRSWTPCSRWRVDTKPEQWNLGTLLGGALSQEPPHKLPSFVGSEIFHGELAKIGAGSCPGTGLRCGGHAALSLTPFHT